MRVQSERESRTSGVMTEARKKFEHHLDLFNAYQAAIKNGRMEGYRLQEQMRSEAMKKRAEALEQARMSAEQLIQESRNSIQTQVQAAKIELAREAHEIARGITATILQRPA